jgi:hypothetical protein
MTAKIQAQEELHVQQCRQRAAEKSKMLRLAKLQRRVTELKLTEMQKRLKCLYAGDVPVVCLCKRERCM